MAASQEHISPAAPMGATLLPDGVTSRFWAPAAERVHVAFAEKEAGGEEQALVVYRFHVGVFSAVDEAGRDFRPHRTAKLLDAAQRSRGR
jgi:hypothetical protein